MTGMRPNLCHRDVCPYQCLHAPYARHFSKAWCAEEEDQTVSEEAPPDPGWDPLSTEQAGMRDGFVTVWVHGMISS